MAVLSHHSRCRRSSVLSCCVTRQWRGPIALLALARFASYVLQRIRRRGTETVGSTIAFASWGGANSMVHLRQHRARPCCYGCHQIAGAVRSCSGGVASSPMRQRVRQRIEFPESEALNAKDARVAESLRDRTPVSCLTSALRKFRMAFAARQGAARRRTGRTARNSNAGSRRKTPEFVNAT